MIMNLAKRVVAGIEASGRSILSGIPVKTLESGHGFQVPRLVLTGFSLFRAFRLTRTIIAGAANATGWPFTTAVGQAKTDKKYDEEQQGRDVALHIFIITPQNP
jgi:hypothetical protein